MNSFAPGISVSVFDDRADHDKRASSHALQERERVPDAVDELEPFSPAGRCQDAAVTELIASVSRSEVLCVLLFDVEKAELESGCMLRPERTEPALCQAQR